MRRVSLLLIVAGALSACAGGQNRVESTNHGVAKTHVSPACPELARWQARQLYGRWSVELPRLGEHGTLQRLNRPGRPGVDTPFVLRRAGAASGW